MKLTHCTPNQFDTPIASMGKSGMGLYAFKKGNSAMRKYYESGEVLNFEVDDDLLLDLTTSNNYNHCKNFLEKELNKKITKQVFQTSGMYLTFYMNKFYPEKKGFINFHFGYELPTSKEVVIFDTSAIKNMSWENSPVSEAVSIKQRIAETKAIVKEKTSKKEAPSRCSPTP